MGRGCTQCNGSGFRGRIGAYELLDFDRDMADALARNDPAAYTAAANAQPGFKRLALCALDYAADGLTTVSEVLRIAEDTAAEAEASAAEVH